MTLVVPVASSKSNTGAKSNLLVPKQGDRVDNTRHTDVVSEHSQAAEQKIPMAREFQRVNGMNSLTVAVISPEAAREERS